MSQPAAWTLLVLSGLVDVAWAYSAKKAQGFAHLGWGLISLALLATFITLLMRALTVLPLGTAYVVWTGIGAVGTLTLGVVVLGEPAGLVRLTLAAIIVLGVVGLKLTTPG